MKISLYDWCLKNGDFGNSIIDEWTGIEVDKKDTAKVIKNNVSIKDVTYGTTRKFKFICKHGHEYCKGIWYKTYSKEKCTVCSRLESSKYCASSYAERLLYACFKQAFNTVYNRYIVNYNGSKYEYDIFIKDIGLCVEYSAIYWHRDNIERSFVKREIAKSMNLKYFEVYDDTYKEYSEYYGTDGIIKSIKYNKIEDEILGIFNHILNALGLGSHDIDIHDAVIEANKYYRRTEPSKSLKNIYEHLFKEADNIINKQNNIRVDELYHSSNKRIHWICTNCGYGINGEWINKVSSRVSNKTGCPRCGYNWYTQNINEKSIKIIDTSETVETIYPELLSEALEDIGKLSAKSNKNIQWRCSKCEYRWNTTIYSRCSRKTSCLKCGYNIFSNSYKKVCKVESSFIDDYPNLRMEVNIELNNKEVYNEKRTSNKKVLWTCPKCEYGSLGEWVSSISSRVYSKSGCRRCGYNSFKDN